MQDRDASAVMSTSVLFFPGKKCSCANIYVFYISDVGKEPVQFSSDDLYWGFFMKVLCNGKVHLPPLELEWHQPSHHLSTQCRSQTYKVSLQESRKITNCKILFLCRLCGPFVHLFHQVIDNSFPGSTIPSPPHIYHNLYKFDILGQLLQFHPTYIYDNLDIQKSECILWSFLVE